MAIERHEPVFGKRRGRSQFAAAQRGQWPAALLQMRGDCLESLGQVRWPLEAHALDREARLRGDAGRVLEHRLDVAVATGLEINNVCHKMHYLPFVPTLVSLPHVKEG